MPIASSEPDDDIDTLEEYLLSADLPDGTMMLSELDGYLTAIALSPEPIPPDEWLPVIWDGAVPPLVVQTDTERVLGTILGRLEAIRAVLDEDAELLDPIFMEDTDGAPLPELWAEGFMRGVRLRSEDWAPLFETEGWRLLAPIGIFASTGDGEPPLVLSDRRREEVRRDAHMLFAGCVAGLRGFWKATTKRPSEKPPRPRPIKAKIGRNALCLCGSGKKYKRCCGA